LIAKSELKILKKPLFLTEAFKEIYCHAIILQHDRVRKRFKNIIIYDIDGIFL